MEEEQIIDQTPLAESVSEQIAYDFFDYFLVKPLDPVKVKKEFSKPVATGTPAKDANGIEAVDYESVETEVKEVDSDYRRGVILKTPLYYPNKDIAGTNQELKIGNIVVFREHAGINFDLLKDSKLLRLYDIVGIEK